MAVYSIALDGEHYKCLEITKRFKIFDMVTIYLRDDTTINGEIVFVEKEKVHITGPYKPIQEIELKDIADIEKWNPPESWK